MAKCCTEMVPLAQFLASLGPTAFEIAVRGGKIAFLSKAVGLESRLLIRETRRIIKESRLPAYGGRA